MTKLINTDISVDFHISQPGRPGEGFMADSQSEAKGMVGDWLDEVMTGAQYKFSDSDVTEVYKVFEVKVSIVRK